MPTMFQPKNPFTHVMESKYMFQPIPTQNKKTKKYIDLSEHDEQMRDKHRLEPDHYIAAAVAKATYRDPTNRDDFNHLKQNGWDYYNNPYNDREMGVWKQKESNHYFIGLKGTQPTSGSDWYHDMSIGTGTELSDSHFIKVQKNVKDFLKYQNELDGNSKFSMSGHSLGGRLVDASVSDTNVMKQMQNAYTFAPGAGPLVTTESARKIDSNVDRGYNYSHLHQHLTGPGDLLSANIKHQEPGTIYHHHTQSHTDWDMWLSRSYWDDYDPSQAPLGDLDLYFRAIPNMIPYVSQELIKSATGYEVPIEPGNEFDLGTPAWNENANANAND